MKYMGGKSRHAKEILPIILAGRRDGQTYVEPFVGGANMIDKVNGRRIGADSHSHLIAMLQAAAAGWTPPRYVSEGTYNEAKADRHVEVSAWIGYVGFAISYAGKWFGGYARDKAGKRDYADESYRNAIKQFPALAGVEFFCCDYRALDIPPASIVYCDPPYADTTGYATGDFDHVAFWHWCDCLVAAGHTVFVSEYQAPTHWRCVWQKGVYNTLTADTGEKSGVERLFTR